jgi:hypothetical protein
MAERKTRGPRAKAAEIVVRDARIAELWSMKYGVAEFAAKR